MPLSSVLFLKTHIVPIGLTPSGSGTSSHTCCLLTCWSSSCMASTQLTPSLMLPMIWSGG
ncbi:hypothetical protein HanXRQr2_Chr16g0777231 [Helianthus annuus]|uniref:Uncharacterized protein n=1 Tax=Helianthus annuus TaxID=4232 RepID=A0A9K3DX03_HELAN|nr:hypothetical protein HanXRQr2_Chr16g0777231 [Helianthus annuus]KAJ0823598.1 hypothetical protein HanPSC8_Chr16g0745581 [Helianthus annuus]